MTSRTWTQRRPPLGFLALSSLMLLSLMLAACGPSAPMPANTPPMLHLQQCDFHLEDMRNSGAGH